MNRLNGNLIAGSINIDKIKRGQEIVLAVPESLQNQCLRFFSVGSILDFDDILLTEEENVDYDHTGHESDEYQITDKKTGQGYPQPVFLQSYEILTPAQK